MAPEEATPVKPVPPPHNVGNSSGVPGPPFSSIAEKPRNIGAYAVQCAKCFKLRLIQTQEEYEEIRQNLIEHPWVCNRKPGVSCDDAADLEFGDTTLWLVDKPNIPKTPDGCKRFVLLRRDCSKLDAYYVMPNGKRVRSLGDVGKFLEAYPQYKLQFAVPDFRFSAPRVMEGMFPGMSMEQGSQSTHKRARNLEMED